MGANLRGEVCAGGRGGARLGLRQGHVDAPLEAAADRRVERPRQVGGAQHEDGRVPGADAVKLDEELRLEAPRTLALAALPRREQAVDLVDEHHGGLPPGSNAEEGPDQLLTLPDPLRRQGGRRDGEEGALRGLGHGLGRDHQPYREQL